MNFLDKEKFNYDKLTSGLQDKITETSSNKYKSLLNTQNNDKKAIIINPYRYEMLVGIEEYIKNLEIAETIKKSVLDAKKLIKYISEREFNKMLKKRGIKI